MGTTIEIREFRPISLRGGVLIECIRGPDGQAATIGNYLVDQLNLDLVGVIDSDDFPSLSTLIDSRPNFPMRIYANTANKISVVVSDFVPAPFVERPLARSIIGWARRQAVAFIVTTCWRAPPEAKDDIVATCSTENAQLRLEQSRIERIDRASIAGIPALLLNEGTWSNMDVIGLLVQPDAQPQGTCSAEKIIEGIDVLLPEVKFQSLRPISEKIDRFAMEPKTGFSDNQNKSFK